jgi:hypothetical protein
MCSTVVERLQLRAIMQISMKKTCKYSRISMSGPEPLELVSSWAFKLFTNNINAVST